MNENQPLIEMRNVSKYFGGVTALQDIEFTVYPNEVVGLAGDNGAGKSTLIKIISGSLASDGGEIFFQGKRVHIKSVRDAKNLGIETIYQDLALIDNLDVPANIFLSRELMKSSIWCFVRDEARMAKETRKILHQLGIEVSSVKVAVRNLSGGQRQAVAIGRAIYFEGKLVIMDEPMAALGVEEKAKVLGLIEKLKQAGISVILISHNLEDHFAVCDRIYVLKNGRNVGMKATKETDRGEILSMMIGEKREDSLG